MTADTIRVIVLVLFVPAFWIGTVATLYEAPEDLRIKYKGDVLSYFYEKSSMAIVISKIFALIACLISIVSVVLDVGIALYLVGVALLIGSFVCVAMAAPSSKSLWEDTRAKK
jgi:hypothetical protein